MRPGAILREQMNFARLRAPSDASAKLKELKAALEKEIAANAKRRDLHRLDRFGFEALELSKLLFYHAPRIGEEYQDDGWDTINLWETYAYEPNVFSSFASLVEATDPIDRELTVRWGSAADGSIGNLSLNLLGAVNRKTASAGFDHFHFNYRTGEYYQDEAYHPQQQADGWRAALEGLGAMAHFRESTVGSLKLPVFGSNVATRPAEHADYTVADLNVGGRKFLAAMHNDALRGGKHFQANISSTEFKSTREALALLEQATTSVAGAIGKPSDITIDFSCLTEELKSFSELLGQVGDAFPLFHFPLPYRKGFKPLALQELDAGEVRAYPLLILKRYKEDIAPVSPMLAVNAVHTDDGTWIELQSSQRPDLIEQAAKAFGGKAEFWQGVPESRWGWYADTSWPGLPETPCARFASGKPSRPVAAESAKAIQIEQQASKKTATEKRDAPKTGGIKANSKKAAVSKAAVSKADAKKSAAKNSAPKKSAAKKSNKSNE